MSFDIRAVREEVAEAKKIYNEKNRVIGKYIQSNFNEIIDFLKSQLALNDYSRILRIKSFTGSLISDLEFEDLDNLKIKEIILYSNSLRIHLEADYYSSTRHIRRNRRGYIWLSYDKLEVFTKDYIEKKFEYERKLQIAEKKVEDLKNAEKELERLEYVIKTSTERYEYLKDLISSKRKKV